MGERVSNPDPAVHQRDTVVDDEGDRSEDGKRENAVSQSRRTLGRLSLSLVAVLTGAVAGLGAVFFRGLIALIHNLLFLGTLSFSYDANVHTPASPWGPFIILVPVIGAMGVTFLVTRYAPEAKGHGVPEVMDAIYYHGGVIRPVVAAVKSVASALSIGSGGSVGREGPIAQIGASFGSTMGQWLGLPAWQVATLIAGGAGAGIAATFNTPVGGILFAIELMLHEVSVRTLIPVSLSTVTAAYVGRLIFGDHPSFVVPSLEIEHFAVTNPLLLLTFIGLGLFTGLASTVYIRSIYRFEDLFEAKIRRSPYLRHGIGMLIVGITMYLLLIAFGHYYIQGVGYATIQDILSGVRLSFGLLLLLFVLKLIATSLTLGSGASGGIFSPSLFLGATLGAAYGLVVSRLAPGSSIDPAIFALAGMAGVVGSATGAAVTAVVMLFEMTLDYNVIIPMTMTVAISYGIRKALLNDSIYTLKLSRRGHPMPESLQSDLHFRQRAQQVMRETFVAIPASTTLAAAALDLAAAGAGPGKEAVVLVTDKEGVVQGVVNRSAFRADDAWESHVKGDIATSRGDDESLTMALISDLPTQPYLVVKPDAALLPLLVQMNDNELPVALVVEHPQQRVVATEVQGVITKERLAEAIADASGLFVD